MAEPLTKAELALARGYAESVYADTTDPQKHTTAVMILRLLDTVAALEADNARLRQLAEVGKAVEGMNRGHCLGHTHLGDIHPEDEWFVWEWPDEYGEQTPLANASTALAALRAAKGHGDA